MSFSSTAIAGALVAPLTPPAIPRVLKEGMLGHPNLRAPAIDLLETPGTLPAMSAVLEEGVLGYPDLLASVIDALESPVALPLISAVLEEGVARHLDSLALIFDALVAPLEGRPLDARQCRRQPLVVVEVEAGFVAGGAVVGRVDKEERVRPVVAS